MARGMAPRGGGGGAGRGMPPRRPTPPRKPPANPNRAQNAAAGRKTAPDLRQLRAAEQQRKTAEQQRKAATDQHRLRQAQHLREAQLARRRNQAERRSAELREQVARLESILSTGLQRSSRIDLDELHRTPTEPPFEPGELATPLPEPAREKFSPGRLAGLRGRAHRERQEADADTAYERAREQWETDEQERKEKLAEAERAHDALLATNREDAERYNARIAKVAAGLRYREPKAVESFLRTVLRRVPLPPHFPRRFEVTHYPYAEQVTLRVVLPGRHVIPAITGYEVAAPPSDEVREVPRPPDEIDELYRFVLAQVVLLVVRDVFEAESGISSVTFLGIVDGLDPASGEPQLQSVLNLSVDRDTFGELDLGEEWPEDCLRRLDAPINTDSPVAVPEPA